MYILCLSVHRVFSETIIISSCYNRTFFLSILSLVNFKLIENLLRDFNCQAKLPYFISGGKILESFRI